MLQTISSSFPRSGCCGGRYSRTSTVPARYQAIERDQMIGETRVPLTGGVLLAVQRPQPRRAPVVGLGRFKVQSCASSPFQPWWGRLLSASKVTASASLIWVVENLKQAAESPGLTTSA